MDTERPISKMQSLLHAIAKLYSNIVATVLHERAAAYHANTGVDDDDDIGVSLREYINQVKKNATPTPSVTQSAVTDGEGVAFFFTWRITRMPRLSTAPCRITSKSTLPLPGWQHLSARS